MTFDYKPVQKGAPSLRFKLIMTKRSPLFLLATFALLSLEATTKTARNQRASVKSKTKLTAHEFEGFKSKKGVIHADKESLSTLKSSNEFVVVLFGAHVCPECQNLLKMAEKVAPKVHSKGVLVPFVYFVCEAEDAYCEQVERINVAPTLRIYHGSMFIEHTGQKGEQASSQWLMDRLIHSINNGTNSLKQINNLVGQSEVVIVLKEDSQFKQFQEFKLLTTFYEFGHFFYTKDEKSLSEIEKLCNDKVGWTTESKLFLMNPENNKCYYFNGHFNYKKVTKFIIEHDKIAVSPFDDNILRLHQKYQIPIVLFFSRDAINNPFYQSYLKIADELKTRLIFAYIDESNLESSLVKRIMNTLGVDRRSFPVVRVMFKQTNGIVAKWKFDGPLERPKLHSWLERLLARKEKPYEKSESSESLTAVNEKGQIERISAVNFESKIEEEQQPVMLVIEGSEETCDNCAHIEQTVLDIRSKFTERQGKFPYRIYRLNVQLNDIPYWTFESVPQIVFVRRNKRIGVYSDVIEVNKVVAFMESKLAEDAREDWEDL